MYMQFVTEYDATNDDDDNMSYKYSLSITWTEMGQLNTYNPIYFNDKGTRED